MFKMELDADYESWQEDEPPQRLQQDVHENIGKCAHYLKLCNITNIFPYATLLVSATVGSVVKCQLRQETYAAKN